MFKQQLLLFHVVSKTFISQNCLVFIPSNILRFSSLYRSCLIHFQPRDNRSKDNFEKNITGIILMTHANALTRTITHCKRFQMNKICFLQHILLNNFILIKYTCLEDFFFNIMGNSSVTVPGFQHEPERHSLQEPFFNENDDNETEQERSSSKVSQELEEWCKCGKYEPMSTEKEGRCCHEAASHYLSGDIRGGSRSFASSKMEIFATDDLQLPDASDVTKGSMLNDSVL